MLTIDYANCLAGRLGSHGLDPDRLAPGSPLAQAATSLTERLQASRGTGWERWRQLPFDPMRAEHIGRVKELTARYHGAYDNLVVLGIGGSALGNAAVHSALNSPAYNLDADRPGPRLFILDNVDPVNIAAVLDVCQASGPGKTLFNVISKSGETAETAAQFLLVRDMLEQALGTSHAQHVVAITDPAKGTMRSICDRFGYETMPVPDGVGGRFSVLSPVGLFSAAMCGIDIDTLLSGAAAMDERCTNPDLAKNPAAMLATLLVELAERKGKPNHVLMPYANSLYLLADWYRQLWAESLGKRVNTQGEEVFSGFTPIKALGATDQHSQVQLYREGPNDKVVGFVEVESFARDLAVPAGASEAVGAESLAYLDGASLTTLLNAEKRATEYALVESNRPNYTIKLPKIDAQHVGEFINLWQIATAYAGLMLGIDAYDQPAVETGKQATFGLMGRPDFEQHKEDVDRVLTGSRFVV